MLWDPNGEGQREEDWAWNYVYPDVMLHMHIDQIKRRKIDYRDTMYASRLVLVDSSVIP